MRGGVVKEARPFASLSSSLLARKGGARPAMRPNSGKSLEDLGWNDMGHDRLPVVPMPAAPASLADALTPAPISYQVAIEENFSSSPVVEDFAEPVKEPAQPVRVRSRVNRNTKVSVAKPVAVLGVATGKSAFTLRLDAERHLRLRLACVISNRSAQKIVIEALDAFLSKMPEIDGLADQVPQQNANGHG
jgi:hypothetical protein